MTTNRLGGLTLAAALAATVLPSAPALADGAASTRNILLGGAAATLLIINHNKKVHEKYAEYDRRQAATQAQANDAEAAYESERQAYAHEAALVASYKHEVAVQHRMVVELRRQVALANQRARGQQVAQTGAHRPLVADARVENPPQQPAAAPVRVAGVSWGWGSF